MMALLDNAVSAPSFRLMLMTCVLCGGALASCAMISREAA